MTSPFDKASAAADHDSVAEYTFKYEICSYKERYTAGKDCHIVHKKATVSASAGTPGNLGWSTWQEMVQALNGTSSAGKKMEGTFVQLGETLYYYFAQFYEGLPQDDRVETHRAFVEANDSGLRAPTLPDTMYSLRRISRSWEEQCKAALRTNAAEVLEDDQGNHAVFHRLELDNLFLQVGYLPVAPNFVDRVKSDIVCMQYLAQFKVKCAGFTERSLNIACGVFLRKDSSLGLYRPPGSVSIASSRKSSSRTSPDESMADTSKSPSLPFRPGQYPIGKETWPDDQSMTSDGEGDRWTPKASTTAFSMCD